MGNGMQKTVWLGQGLQRCCQACWSCPWASNCLRVAFGTSGQRRATGSQDLLYFVWQLDTPSSFKKDLLGWQKNVTILLSLVLLCFFLSSDCWGIEGDIGSVQSFSQNPRGAKSWIFFQSQFIPFHVAWLGCAGRFKSRWYNRSELSLARIANLQVNCGKLSFPSTEANRYTFVHPYRQAWGLLRVPHLVVQGQKRMKIHENDAWISWIYDVRWICMNASSCTLTDTSVRKTSFAAVPEQRDQRTGSALSL